MTPDPLEDLVKKYPQHRRDAFVLIFEGLERFLASQTTRRHVKAEELLAGIMTVSIDLWGPLAGEVFRTIGITKVDDFGKLVEILIKEQLLVQGPNDKIEDFMIEEGASLDDLVEASFQSQLENDPPRLHNKTGI